MKKLLQGLILLLFGTTAAFGQGVPEILYYQFDGTGTAVPNMASNPPAGTATGNILGLSQGSNGLCGGALIGNGGSSSSNYVSTGWNTSLGNNPWTIMFWTSNVPNSTTLFYQFGDASAGGFRCFNNGVAGPGNWLLRGPINDIICTGCAPVGLPSMTTFVYDPIAGTLTSYHDGVLNTTVSQAPVNITGLDFKVGGYGSSTGMGAGQLMDEFRFYDRALDANEILLIANQCLPLASGPNDAGIFNFVGPVNFCADTLPIEITLKNYGTAILDSCIVNWTINGVPRPSFTFVGPLDTLNGSGSQTAIVTLGNEYFANGTSYDIVAWTSMPNNAADTINYNDTIQFTLQASLAGNYTIGGPGADYPDFSSAAADLIAFGVCAPVVFDVYDTIYYEQVDFASISGASATNTILFRPISGMPTVRFAATATTDNYVFKMSGADHITFDGLNLNNNSTVSYGHVIEFTGGSDYNTFQNCKMLGDTIQTTTSTNIAVLYSNTGVDEYNSFIGNEFRGGSYNVYWYGTGTTTLESGNVFEGNEFLDTYYYGVRLYYQNSPSFTHNRISTPSTNYTGTTYAAFFGYCDNNFVMTHNQIESSSDFPRYGMYFTECDASLGGEGLVANNVLHQGSGNSSTYYGLYTTGSEFQRYYNNSIYLDDIGTTSRAFYVTSGSNIELKNNIFDCNLGYAAYFSSTSAVVAADHNNYRSNGTALAYYSGAQADLASLQLASGMDANSMSVNPNFYGPNDLHICNDTLDGAGIPVLGVVDDIDGEMRDTLMPDIGADERVILMPGFLGADVAVCQNDTVWLNAGTSRDTVMWSNGTIGNSVALTSSGIYTVEVVNPCGSTIDTIEVIVNALPIVDAGSDLAVCEGDSVTLSGTGAANYTWDQGIVDGQAFTASGVNVYNVVGVDSNGCSASDSVMVTATIADTTLTLSGITLSVPFDAASSYQWLDCGNGNAPISGMTSNTFTPTVNGNYACQVTNGGCVLTSGCMNVIVIAIEASIPDFSMEILPNPASTFATISANLGNASNLKLELLNAVGQVVYEAEISANAGSFKHPIDIRGFGSGLYFVRVEIEGLRNVQRLMITH